MISLPDGHWTQAVGVSTVAELAVGVVAPAIGGAARGDPARVVDPSVDRREVAHTEHGIRTRSAKDRPIAELAVIVQAPAGPGARGGHAAGMGSPPVDFGKAQPSDHRRGSSTGGGGAVSKLTLI